MSPVECFLLITAAGVLAQLFFPVNSDLED